MVSFQVRLGIAAGILALAAYAPNARADDEPTPVARNQEQRSLVETITQVQSRDGPFAPALIGPLTELAMLYEETGDADFAAATTQRALQVLRVNRGLYTFDQAPLLQQTIQNEASLGDQAAVDRLRGELKTLVERNPNDLRVAPVLRDFGDEQMLLMQKLLAGELPDPVWIGVSPAGNGATLGRGERARAMALIALHYYSRAIVTLQRHQAYTNDLLDELETQVVGISYVMFHAYNTGRASLMRQVSYAAARGDPLVARTVALIHVADWDLVFTKHGTALDTYEQAYALLKQNGVPAEAIDSLFAPRVPIMLPTFLPNPLATDALEATGYIDVAFDVHKYGSANHVEILDSTPNATGADKEALVSLIRLGNFRPRVTEGEFARSSSVTLRYFLHAPSAVAND